MKKILIVLVILAVAISGVFAEGDEGGGGEGPPAPEASGLLNVYGRIGEVDIDFVVSQTFSEKIDLVGNEEVQPDGSGVEVGKWEFIAISRPSNSKYSIEYIASKLVSDTTGKELDFEVVESVINGASYYSEGQINFNVNALVETLVKVRLTEGVGENPEPAKDFKGTIVVNLYSES